MVVPLVGVVGAAFAVGFDGPVVAEGVETEDQLAFLRTNGCDELQGFLLSRPLDGEGLVDLLEGLAVDPLEGLPDGRVEGDDAQGVGDGGHVVLLS